MVRMRALPESSRAGLESLACPSFEEVPFTGVRSLKDARIALVSSAGLMHRDEPNVNGATGGYRAIADTTPDADVLMNHVSVNFDRTGYQRDVNVILPRARLKELEADNVISAASPTHYAFMGATEPEKMRDSALQLASELKAQNINTVCLLPV